MDAGQSIPDSNGESWLIPEQLRKRRVGGASQRDTLLFARLLDFPETANNKKA